MSLRGRIVWLMATAVESAGTGIYLNSHDWLHAVGTSLSAAICGYLSLGLDRRDRRQT